MTETHSDKRAASMRRAIGGAAALLIGVLTLAALIYISNSRTPAAEHALIRLGLAGSALLSATAQGLVFFGGWLLWRAWRRRRP